MLAVDNPTDQCSPCARRHDDPAADPDFWRWSVVAEAVAGRDIGAVSLAYRRHPAHRHPISQSEVAHRLGLTQGQISRVESGRSRVVDLDRLTRWAEALRLPPGLAWWRYEAGAVPDSPKPFRVGDPRRSKGEEESVDRRQFLTGALAVTGWAAAVDLTDADEATLIRVPTASYRRLDATTSARQLIGPVRAHLGLARKVAARRSTVTTHAAASEVAGFCGWLYADLDDRARAREYYRLAVHHARRAGDPLVGPYMTASLGQFAAEAGEPQQGLALFRSARAQLPSPTPTIALAWLGALEAVALAQTGDRTALAVLDHAEHAAAAETDTEPRWPWVFAFDARKLAAFRAVVAARLGMVRIADTALIDARDVPQSPKAHASALVDQATAHARTGDQDRAVALGCAAFDIARRHDSERVLRRVMALRTQLRPGRAVTALDERLSARYA